MEERLIHKILKKTSHSFSEMRNVILKVRNNALSYADTILEFGVKLIRNNSKQLDNEFMLLEAAGRNDVLSIQVQDNLAKNVLDYDTKKRVISQTRYSKTDGSQVNFVQKMNAYLEENPNDGEAWLELGDFYLETLNYQKALHCYEELIVLYPKRYIYMMRVAEICSTLGTEADLLNARSYYSFVLNKMSNNYRCLWGLIQTCRKLKALNPEDAKNNQLLETSVLALKAFYKEKGQSHLVDSLEF